MIGVRILGALLVFSAIVTLVDGAGGTKPVAEDRGFSPEVAGLRGRLHALERDADGTCYAKYTLYAGKDFRGRRGQIYAVGLRFFDATGKPIKTDPSLCYLCGEHSFSDWKGYKSVLQFTPPAKAVFVSALLTVDGADLITERVRLPVSK